MTKMMGACAMGAVAAAGWESTDSYFGARIDDPDTVLQYGPGYDHNWVLDGSGFRKVAEMRGKARALETQHFPNTPNRPDFPTTNLKPGETYRTVTEYRFKTR